MLAAAFRWTEVRTVTRTGTVSLHGNTYVVDAALVGYRVELCYDPTDLTGIEVFHREASHGPARPETIDVHVHPRVAATLDPPAPTGIAYLDAVAADHAHALRERLSYAPPVTVTATDDGQAHR